MTHSRRQFLIGAASLAAAQIARARIRTKVTPPTRLILLGTKGGPRPGATGRSNPANLLLVNDIPYVIDCGYGASRQLLSAGVSFERLRYIFITHHHSDHNLELGPMVYNAWSTGRPMNIDAYGPVGLKKMARDFFEYQKFDIDTRIVDEGRQDLRKLLSVHEIARPGLVMQNNDVKVTCCRVRHPPITASYAYRFDAKDRSVAFSGDTAYSPELVELARGVDVLVHEVMYLPAVERLVSRLPEAKRLREHLMVSHTLPEDVGRVASQAGVKTLVLSHFVPGDDPSITDEQWSEGVRKHFKGRIVVGKDLMEIEP